MDPLGELLGKRTINHALAFQTRFASEGGSDNNDAEMRFAFRPRAGMASMSMRFVLDEQLFRIECVPQLALDFHSYRSHDGSLILLVT